MKIVNLKTPITKTSLQLTEGDVVMSHGEKLVFLEFKMGLKSFVAQSVSNPDKKYKVRVVTGASYLISETAIIEKEVTEIDLLRKSPIGTLFVIKNRKSAECFKLKGFSPSGKIKAETPFGDSFNIDPSFTVKLISNIK